ncbi:hypothetical protein scyTo_0016630, partial [Scyliorhinus torazame]|nr:hypothetical protein [Scyliorhinus torazame]
MGEPVIGLQPEPLRVKVGQRASLRCVAFGIPAPKYQWHRNGIPLPHQTKAELVISTVEMRHHGTYLCSVANDRQQECWSSAADVSVVENIPIAISLPSLRISGSGQRKVTAKSPTVCRKADTPQEVGLCALFYYAGHGYECSGRNYMVPVNAPNPYRPENCINVQKILCRMQVKNTALNVLLLDMCRKWYNQAYLPSDLQPLAPTGNIVYGYATCEDAEAYEVQDGEHSSGIFMKYLKRHILKKEKVTQILENVSE